MQPRRKQTAITFRSDRAAERLRMLTRDGRSQAEIIEHALDLMPGPGQDEVELKVARLQALLDLMPNGPIPTMAEFDAIEYDENGLPR